MLSALGALIPTGLQLIGGNEASNQQSWNNNARISVLTALNQLLGNSTGNINAYGNALEPFLTSTMQGQITNGMANQSNLLDRIGSAYNGILNGAFSNPTDTSRIPGLQGVFDTNGGLINGATQGAQFFGNNLNSILNNPQLQQAVQSAMGLANGGGGQGMLSSIANEMLSNRGMSPIAGLIQQSASGLLPTEGYNPQLNYATQYGEALTQPNPYVNQVQNRASQIIGKEPLLSMDQVLSMTRDQNATDANQQLQALKRQLINTTGITGPAIAGGGYNELLSEFGDQALQSQAQAQDQAMMNQQGLQLNEFGQGANLFNSGIQGQLGLSGQGLNALLQAAGQANSNLGVAGGLGLGSGSQQLQNLMGGAGLQGQANNTTLSALQSVLSSLGLQNSMLGTNAGALGNLLGLAGGLTQNQAGNVFGLQNFGQQSANNQYNALSNIFGQQGNTANSMVGQGLQAAQFPQSVLNNWMSLLGNVYQNMTSLFGNVASNPVNFYSPAAGTLQATQANRNLGGV